MPGDARPILTIGLYGRGSIHKTAAIKVSEHSPTGGMIRRAQVGNMASAGTFYSFVGIWFVHACICVRIAIVLALGFGGSLTRGAHLEAELASSVLNAKSDAGGTR